LLVSPPPTSTLSDSLIWATNWAIKNARAECSYRELYYPGYWWLSVIMN
jgi:hypothetical protein